jgi:hypothetical protein
MLGLKTAPVETRGRLCAIAKHSTGQSRGVDFLLAWHNAEENGGWGPSDFWNASVADDLLSARESRRYPGDLGFEPEISASRRLWRRAKP